MRPRIKTPVVSVKILPSAMTVAAICLGLSAVKFALDGRPTEAMAFLAIAAILDALDGRLARALKARPLIPDLRMRGEETLGAERERDV